MNDAMQPLVGQKSLRLKMSNIGHIRFLGPTCDDEVGVFWAQIFYSLGPTVSVSLIKFWPFQVWGSHCLNLIIKNEHSFTVAAISRSASLFGASQIHRSQNDKKNWNYSIHSYFWQSSVNFFRFIWEHAFECALLKIRKNIKLKINFIQMASSNYSVCQS